jgi:hypothetical protein
MVVKPVASSRRAVLRAAILGSALLLMLSACGGTDSSAGDDAQLPSAVATSPDLDEMPSPTSPANEPWIVSLGDSFISGEAGRWAGNSADGSTVVDALGPTAYFDAPDGQSELIPLCHRSKSAMVHIGDDGTPDQPGDPVGSTNLACSGAETRTMTESGGAFKPGLDFVGAGTAQSGQAAMLQDLASSQDVRMVVVSIGGNDFGFADVISDCAEDFIDDGDYCSDDSTDTDRASQASVDTITQRITTALQNVQKAMRQAGRADGSWTLVVNLNPDTLPLSGAFRYPESYTRWNTGGCPFYDQDAQWAGTTFVGAVRSAAAGAVVAAKISPAVLLDLSKLLDGQELCAEDTRQVGASIPRSWKDPAAAEVSEWAAELRVRDSSPYFEQESLHPNYWGQLAARSCVRQLYALPNRVSSVCTANSDVGPTSRGEPAVTLSPRT